MREKVLNLSTSWFPLEKKKIVKSPMARGKKWKKVGVDISHDEKEKKEEGRLSCEVAKGGALFPTRGRGERRAVGRQGFRMKRFLPHQEGGIGEEKRSIAHRRKDRAASEETEQLWRIPKGKKGKETSQGVPARTGEKKGYLTTKKTSPPRGSPIEKGRGSLLHEGGSQGGVV